MAFFQRWQSRNLFSSSAKIVAMYFMPLANYKKLALLISAFLLTGCAGTSADHLNENMSASSSSNAGVPVFTGIVKNVKPAVVNISTYNTQNQASQNQAAIKSLGSGFIISENGVIVTVNHLIENSETILVRISAEENYKAGIIASDKDHDIALIEIQPDHPLPFVKLGNSETLDAGEWVIAIGNPFGLGKTVTAGIISAKGRVIGSGKYDELLQTDASINPGNSGGPLLNMKGEVVGINTAAISAGANSNIGFAIPVNTLKKLIEQNKLK
jgi:S1-C subfamily serine protease